MTASRSSSFVRIKKTVMTTLGRESGGFGGGRQVTSWGCAYKKAYNNIGCRRVRPRAFEGAAEREQDGMRALRHSKNRTPFQPLPGAGRHTAYSHSGSPRDGVRQSVRVGDDAGERAESWLSLDRLELFGRLLKRRLGRLARGGCTRGEICGVW